MIEFWSIIVFGALLAAVIFFRDRQWWRAVDELQADLDLAVAEHDSLQVYVAELSAYVQELEDQRPATGRHAHTGRQRAAS